MVPAGAGRARAQPPGPGTGAPGVGARPPDLPCSTALAGPGVDDPAGPGADYPGVVGHAGGCSQTSRCPSLSATHLTCLG